HLKNAVDASGCAESKDQENSSEHEQGDERELVAPIHRQVKHGSNRPEGGDRRSEPSPHRNGSPEALVGAESKRKSRSPGRLDGPGPGEYRPEDDIEDGEDAERNAKEGHGDETLRCT